MILMLEYAFQIKQKHECKSIWFNVRINETRFLVQHESFECKCGLNESVCDSKEKRNHNECRCDCKELYD